MQLQLSKIPMLSQELKMFWQTLFKTTFINSFSDITIKKKMDGKWK